MKQNKIISNQVGGYDLITERDGGNTVRILTGKAENSNKFWRSLLRLSTKALKLIKEEDFKGEIADQEPEWEALNTKLIEDNRRLLATLYRMRHIENMADALVGTGMVDNPHTKAMRAMVAVAQTAIEMTENELYRVTN